MSNGVEVLVRDKSSDGKQEKRKLKVMSLPSSKPYNIRISSTPPNKSLLSSATATIINQQHISALFPLHQLMQHNYIIKTCMTTYTYLTTVVQNKRSAVSTFETIVSVVTTESLTNLYATDVIADLKPTKTKYMDVKTIQPSVASNIFVKNIPKIDKRIDSDEDNNFDVIQPSEINHASCTTSCSCSHTQTEMLKTKYTHNKSSMQNSEKYNIKTSKYSGINVNIKPTHKNVIESTLYHPYEYESSSQGPPTDKIVEIHTQVNDYSDEKDSNSVENSDLLTNEQEPLPTKSNKDHTNKTSEKIKPEKPQKINKNKFVVAELLKLGSLGIKGLSQLAPVIEKMTGGFMKRQEINKTISSSTTLKPPHKITSYKANKRVDNDVESKVGNFPIYIPVDEMEASESQISLTNVTLHQNFAWAAEHKNPISHLIRPKIVHESPLVNGGIPISPGEIITANSDVIVGKPAVGGPFTLVAGGIKLQNNVHPPVIDSVVANNDLYITKENPLKNKNIADDSFDLRPPEMPKSKPKLNKNVWPQGIYTHTDKLNQHLGPSRLPSTHAKNEHKQSGLIKANSPLLVNHGRPAFLDYIPPLSSSVLKESQVIHRYEQNKDQDIPDNNPSSSEVVITKVTTDGKYSLFGNADTLNKPLLVDIQPSRVANVLIPHGSSTALVFAGSSEPHKTGDYVDDPLPYPEPGYFGSFSIDAPQMTNVHNVVPNKNQFFVGSTISTNSQTKSSFSNKESNGNSDHKVKWNDNKHPGDFTKIPPPTSNQETYVRVGPQITVYNTEIYKDFENHVREKKINSNLKEGKGGIDKEYENYLAVPPPPPQLHLNQNIPYDKNKYHQRPIVHTKPALDSNVFLNIQHPVSSQLPPKVTSEIYFASQMPNNYPTPTYKINMPPPIIIEGTHSNLPFNPSSQFKKQSNTLVSSKTENKSNLPTNNRENTYTVTLNTATNVAGESASGHIVGSSISVPITTSLNGQINADIPIGTNFAIRVEDDPAKYESVALHGKRHPSLTHVDQGQGPFSYIDGYKHRTVEGSSNKTNTFSNSPAYTHNNVITNKLTNKKDVNVQPPSLNSHANFPIINENFNKQQDSKPSFPFSIPNMNTQPKLEERPSQFLPNITTNSHGWYASVLNEENLKNIKVDATTRKIIPLKYDINSDNVPKFGEKIATVGIPPTQFWDQNKQPVNNFNVGKPFSKGNEVQNPHVSSINVKQNYIPSILNNGQKVYDIPTKEYSYETTSKSSYLEPIKTIYETADEIYDGEDGFEDSELDSEVSSESMKVPIITPSKKIENERKDSSSNVTENSQKKYEGVQLVKYNSGSQTEKPFTTQNRTSFHSNSIKPIYGQNIYTKPRPFTPNSNTPLDHQLQQPHWHINQLMENATNMSYEDNMYLNIGEEMYPASTSRPATTRKPSAIKDTELSHNKQQKPFSSHFKNSTRFGNESNIITSTVHIQDKKPLLLEVNEKSTIPVFTIRDDLELNISSSEIIDLSPPPPIIDNNLKLKLSTMQEIMGMSPPPPRTTPSKYTSRAPGTSRPLLPIRTSPPYRTLPPRTLQSKQTTQRPLRKPISKDDISTYRPMFDVVNKMKRPYINRDQPSSHLLPPPRDIPSVVASIDNISMLISSVAPTTNVIFPTSVSTSWLISSNIEFPTNAYYSPTSVYFPDAVIPSEPFDSDIISLESSSEHTFNSKEYETSSEVIDVSYEKPIIQKTLTVPKYFNKTRPLIEKESDNISSTESESGEKENISSEISSANVNEDKMKITIGNKNRTRKPYPIRGDDKKTVTNRFKPPSKIIPIIKPTRTLSRPEISHPTRLTSIKKIIRPIPSRPLGFMPTNIIESSESSLEEDYVRPTEVLNENVSTLLPQLPSVFEKTITSTLTISQDITDKSNIHKTHYAGNEIKVSDEIIPTKTEFKTTIITLTKTLSEPPQIISSIGYVNLTHTLTVTHTETSLVSQSEGAITETLVLTNIHTSTIVDVVTEVYTQVQPTTIVETVTKHFPIPQVEATPVSGSTPITKIALDDINMSSEESDNFIIKDEESNVTENIQKIDIDDEKDNETFFVVMNKSQNGGKSPPIGADIDTGDYDGITRNEQVNSNGVSQVLFGEILLAGTPYSETTNMGHPIGTGYGKECHPDCKASRNERCQRIEGVMKCVCRPGFARMFPDRPCKPTYTYSVRLALGFQGKERLKFHSSLSNNSTKEYNSLAVATHEGINRMVMQSDLRDVYHGVHITGFYPIEIKPPQGEIYTGVINKFYVQLSDNAHESRLKEVIEKYLRNNNYSLGGTEVHAAEELMDRLNVSDFDECTSTQFHDCSEHARCFNLRGTYTCSCLEGFADLSVNILYPGRICSSDAVGCGGCNYHGTCFERESAMICECFKWYAGRTCQVNLKAVLITVTVVGAVIILAVTIWASKRCCSPRSPATQTFVIGCMQGMPSIHQGNIPSKQRADRRALIAERMETAETGSIQNASLPYIPTKSRSRSSCSKKIAVISDPPAHAPPPPPAPALMIPRARLHPLHSDSRDNLSRKKSTEICSEAKLISYLESGVTNPADEMRRKHSMESSYSINKERCGKQGALVSAGFKVSTTIRPDESVKEDRDDASSVTKTDLEDASRFDTLRKTYSQEDMSEWTDAERRIGELTLSEARSVGGTLPASTGRAASSTRLTHQEANTMAERDLGSTFLLPHVHLYKPDLTSDVSEFDSL